MGELEICGEWRMSEITAFGKEKGANYGKDSNGCFIMNWHDIVIF